MNTFFIIVTLLIFSTIIFNTMMEIKKYKQYMSRLHVGTRLMRHVKFLDDEFDPGYTFYITIIQLGDKQVKVKFNDGSCNTMDKSSLYEEHWTIINETK